MINNSFTQNAQSKKQSLIAKVSLFPIFFFLLFQVIVYSQQAGNCLRVVNNDPLQYAEGTGISTSFTALTIEAWIIPKNIQGTSIQRFVSVGGDGAVIRQGTASYRIDFYLHFTNGSIPIVSLDLNSSEQTKWTHLAGTWDGSTMKLYENGKLVSSAAASGTLSMDNYIRISKNDLSESWVAGWIDEIRLWNVARTMDQINDNMYKELSGSESGLTNYWKFNETSGTTASDSKGSAHMTLHNFSEDYWVNSGAFAGPRNALSFDGTDDYVSIADNSSLHLSNTVTIEAWVYPTNLNGRFSIYSTRRNNEAGSYQLEVGNGDVGAWSNRVSVSGVGTWIAQTNDNAISTNVWTHIVYTRSGTGAGSQKIYINGVEQTLITDNDYSFVDNSSVKLIGAGNSLANYFAGQIDEVRIWNDVRTQSEIADNMCMALKGNETGLISYWRFDQVAGVRAPEITSNNVGTLINMADDDWVAASEFNTWVDISPSPYWTTSEWNWSLGHVPTSSENVGIPETDPEWSSFTLYLDADRQCKTLSVRSGVTLGLNTYTLTISGNAFFIGALSANSAGDKIILSGGSSVHNIYASSSLTIKDVQLNDANGAKMLSNCTINGTLTLTSGDLDLNGFNITLGSSATLTESTGNTVKGTSGKVSITKNIGIPTNANVGGLGAVITSASNLGSTIVERTHSAATGAGNQGILRKYKIQPVTNSGLAATLRLYYDESELNSISESNLSLFKSPDGTDNSWNNQNGNANSTDDYVELTGINDFSYWTLGNNASPLPVELTSFIAASTSASTVELYWKTATEVNNYGFDIERQMNNDLMTNDGNSQSSIVKSQWQKIGFVQGSGNSNSLKEYYFVDKTVSNGTYLYRLKQIDNDGGFNYSQEVEVKVEAIPTEFALVQNYPNPFNPTTVIRYQLPTDSYVTLKLCDILGREVATLVNEQKAPGNYEVTFNASSVEHGINIASGVYFYTLVAKSADEAQYKFHEFKKCLLIK